MGGTLRDADFLCVGEGKLKCGGGLRVVSAEVRTTGLFASQRSLNYDASEIEKVGRLTIKNCNSFRVGMGEGMEGGLKMGGVALDAGVGPEEGLEFEAGDGAGLGLGCGFGRKAYPRG